MMKLCRVGSKEMQRHARDLLDGVGIRGELRVITRHKRDEAALVPMAVLEDWQLMQDTPALREALEAEKRRLKREEATRAA